ncbi:MAG: DUF4404 domain-containing protein [Deltaproteobacteria bacterium]|nr:DUF4404 domain-containing protein [Deltaproteobacteria bacterium]
MIRDTLDKIEAQLRGAGTVNDATKTELLRLLAVLKAEVSELSRTQTEQAHTIAGFVAVSAHEATRAAKSPELVRLSLKGLALSVRGYEQSHPKLVEGVNAICTALANVGL